MGNSGHGNILKNKWVQAGLGAAAAGTGLGLAGIGPMAGLLGGGTAASGLAGGLSSMIGPSAATAALAGDAYLPAALGAAGEGTAGMGSLLGGKFASGVAGKTLGTGLANMGKAQAAMSLLNPQQAAPQGMGGMPQSNVQPQNTVLYPQGVGAVGSSEQERLKAILAMLQQGQGRA